MYCLKIAKHSKWKDQAAEYTFCKYMLIIVLRSEKTKVQNTRYVSIHQQLSYVVNNKRTKIELLCKRGIQSNQKNIWRNGKYLPSTWNSSVK